MLLNLLNKTLNLLNKTRLNSDVEQDVKKYALGEVIADKYEVLDKTEFKTTQKLNDFKVGGIVTIGNFVGPIEWQVLEVKNNKALLLSKHILFRMPFDANGCLIWKASSLRHFLNGKFYENCFTKREKRAIIQRFNKTNSGDTEDRLFLLSIEEVYEYFSEQNTIIAVDLNERADWWWLRCRGDYYYGGACVRGNGIVDHGGDYAGDGHGGVRIALQWNLES